MNVSSSVLLCQPKPAVKGFLTDLTVPWLRDRIDQANLDYVAPSVNAVTVCAVHQAKGMQWPIGCVPALVEALSQSQGREGDTFLPRDLHLTGAIMPSFDMLLRDYPMLLSVHRSRSLNCEFGNLLTVWVDRTRAG